MASVRYIFCIVCIASLLYGCLRVPAPIAVKEPVLTDDQQTKYNDIVLTKRVFVEHGNEKVILYVDVKENDVTATSNFGMEHEIASLDCIAAGIHQTIKASTIIPTDKFWDEIANYETLNLSALFDKSYFSKLDTLGADYLIVAHHQRTRVRSWFGEFIFLGAVGYGYEEEASALIVDMKQRRIIDAIETNLYHTTGVNHWGFVPAYVGVYPEEDPCVAIGIRAAELIAQSSKVDRAPRILVVAAKTYPYSPRSSSRNQSEDWSFSHDISETCIRADLGYADAQSVIGDIFYLGLYGNNKNPVQAYMWYSLAASNTGSYGSEYATNQLNTLHTIMTPEQLTEAKHRLNEWSPGQCERELIGTGRSSEFN